MKEGLNLLPSVAKFQAAKIKLKKKINLAMAVFLGVWVFFAVVVFGWLGVNSYYLNKANKENDKALKRYKTLVDQVVLLKKNKYQASLVNKVLSERFEYGASIKKVTELFSEGIGLDNFQIKDKKRFILKGSLTNGARLIEVEEMVRDINAGLMPDFSRAKMTSVSLGYGLWLFELEVDLV